MSSLSFTLENLTNLLCRENVNNLSSSRFSQVQDFFSWATEKDLLYTDKRQAYKTSTLQILLTNPLPTALLVDFLILLVMHIKEWPLMLSPKA